jgi:hypothetical protein
MRHRDEAACVKAPQAVFVSRLDTPHDILKTATRMEDDRPDARAFDSQHPKMREIVPLRV